MIHIIAFVTRTKAIMWIIEAAHTYFLIRLNSFKSTLYSVQLFTWMNTIAPPKSCDKKYLQEMISKQLDIFCALKVASKVLWHIGCFCKWKKKFPQPLVYVTSVWKFLITVICYCSAFKATRSFLFWQPLHIEKDKIMLLVLICYS